MSTLDSLPDGFGRSWGVRILQRARRWAWLAPGLVAGLCVYAAYLLTHPRPAFGAGLFLAMSEQVVRTFPVLPETVPGYTAAGVPMAYPPLMFYVVGVLTEVAGVDGIAVTRHLPPLVSVVALVPLYLFAEELLGSRPAAGLATLLCATAPPILQWQISAGGIVRAPAYLFTAVGLYAGLRVFRDRGRRWLAPALTAFALTVLTHPVYTVFFVLSYLVLFVAFDRTIEGLARGAGVGVGGTFLSAAWWGQVVLAHGIDVLTGAAGTHGGIGKQIPDLVMLFAAEQGTANTQAVLFAIRPGLFDFSTPGMAVITVWSLAIVAAWFGLLYRDSRRTNRAGDTRTTFLAGWAVLSVVFVSKPRFSFLIGSLLIAAAVERFVLPAMDAIVGGVRDRRVLARVALGILAFTAATTTGTLYAGSQLDTHAGSTSLPAFVDAEDADAMEWVATNTGPDAEFVVLGDAAEWFPYLTDRTILVGPWGVEWRGKEQYQSQLDAFNRLSTCDTAACLTDQMGAQSVQPDYVYVQRDRYTVRGMEVTASPDLTTTLLVSDRYRLVYENAGVMIFEYRPDGRAEIRPVGTTEPDGRGDSTGRLSAP